MERLGEQVFKLRRLPLAGGLVAALLICAAGIYWFLAADFTVHGLSSSISLCVELFGVVLLTLFGLAGAVFFGVIVLDWQNALVVNDEGLQFKSSFFTIEFIPWNLVEHIGLFNVQSRDVYVVHIEKPRDFIDCHQGFMIRFALKVNNEMSGSPIAVVHGLLEVGETNLMDVLNQYCDRYAS